MRGAITERQIKTVLMAGVAKRRIVWDGSITGLGLRLFPSGATSWVYVFRPKGAKRGTPSSTLTIGSWPAIGITDARAAARIHAGKIALGGDPAAELREKRLQPRRLLAYALDEFEANLKRRRIVNTKSAMSALRRGLAPWMAREVETLSRAMIVDRIEALEALGKPGAAIELRRASRTFLEWCLTKGLVANNVLAGLRRPKVSRAERLDDAERKGRALNDAEIRAVWVAAGTLGAFGGLIRLAMLTGMRRGELASLTWDAIQADRVVIHAHGTKTGVRHEVPLTALMRNVIQAQSRTTSTLVFPSTRRHGKGQFGGWTSLVKSAIRASGVDFHLHDLRRTVRTRMSQLGVSEEIAELAIGHLRRGLVGVYNKDEAWTKRTEAFELVSNAVATIVADGSGAVPLRAR